VGGGCTAAKKTGGRRWPPGNTITSLGDPHVNEREGLGRKGKGPERIGYLGRETK